MRKLEKQLFSHVGSGDVAKVQELLANGLDPNTVNNGTEKITPLMVAVKNNDVPMIRRLLEFKANTELMDFAGRDAYDYAERHQSSKALFTLLQYAEQEDNNYAG